MKELNEPDLEQRVLEFVRQPNFRPMKPRDIAKQLGLEKESRPEVRRAVKRLVRQGLLAYGSNHLVALPDTTKTARTDEKHVSGTYRRTSSGFGFVRPTGATPADKRDDIFIPESKALDAADGDLVLVRIGKRRDGDRVRYFGTIVEVLERDTHRFVGTYFEREGSGYVNVDGAVFAQPLLVGDAGAKGVERNDKVVIEIVVFPSHMREGEGVIVEVLGRRGEPGVDTLSILREYHLPDKFPEEVLEAAREQARKFDEEITRLTSGEPAGVSPGDSHAETEQDGPGAHAHRLARRDLRHETIITIDPKDARDFDDAISLVRLENGHWRLGVHIADVAHFVPRRSPLDREARDRATSVYLPDRVIPMLPEIISNNLASLQPHRPRFAKSVIIEFTAEGVYVDSEFHNSLIENKRRFNYEEIDDFLREKHHWKHKLTVDVFALLERMHELAMILRRRRLQRGAIELTLPEVKIDLDRDGRVKGAHVVENTVSHQIIEEFMLAANEAVATTLTRREVPFLRRTHDPPSPLKLKNLTEFVHELGIECESLESRFEIKRVVEQVAGKPEERAVNYAVLRSMSKALYSPSETGHYALHSENYCHFTSPIRRYPDLTVHRLLDRLASGHREGDSFEKLEELGEHCSEREQRAEAAERELTKIKLLDYLRGKLGQQMEAVVTGVENFGLFAQGVELPAEGLIHITTLRDDVYRYEATTHTLAGFRSGNTYRLGDVLIVEVARVDIDRRELDFRLVRRLRKAPARPPLKPSKKSPVHGKKSKRKSTRPTRRKRK